MRHSQYDRQVAVVEATGNGIQMQKSEEKPRLWLHSSSKSMSIVGNFIDNHQLKSDFGLVYKATQARSANNIKDITARGQVVLDKGGSFLLDPCTYLQVLDKKHHRGTKHFDYSGVVSPEQIVNPPKFVQGYTDNYVKEVIKAQEEMGVSAIISPYLYIETVDDFSAEANFLLWRETNDYLESDSENCYFALLISERLVLSRKELMELALMISNHRFAKKIYLRLESKRESSQPMWDRDYMENLKDFLIFVSQTSNILLASSGIEGLGYLCFGLAEVGTNPLFSQRKFSFSDKSSTRGGGTEPIPRYFTRSLLNEVLVPQEVDTPMSANPAIRPIFDCSCGFCPNRDKESRLKHYLVNYDEMFSSIANSKDVNDFKNWIEAAIDNYDLLEDEGLQFSPSTNGNFLSVWRQVFTQ